MYRFLKGLSIRFHRQTRLFHHHVRDGGDDDAHGHFHGRDCGRHVRDGGDDVRVRRFIQGQNRFQHLKFQVCPFWYVDRVQRKPALQ